MSKQPFARVLAAVATPFTEDASIDVELMAQHCRWLLQEGCDGLVIFGSTGESASLTLAERMAALEGLYAQGTDANCMIVGTGCCAIADTVTLSRHAHDLGCRGVLVMPPFYFKDFTPEGVFQSYVRTIEGVGDRHLRLYIYHFPQASGVPIPTDMTEKLVARFPGNIRGYKDSSGDFENMCEVIKRCPGIDVYSGSEARLLDGLRQGAAGCISATANVQPQAIRAVVEAWAAGSVDADALQLLARENRLAIQAHPMVPAVKALLAEIHGNKRWQNPRLPMSPFGARATEALLAELNSAFPETAGKTAQMAS